MWITQTDKGIFPRNLNYTKTMMCDEYMRCIRVENLGKFEGESESRFLRQNSGLLMQNLSGLEKLQSQNSGV